LVHRALPYQLVGAVRFFERREIKDLLAYLRLLVNPADVLALNRVINVPPRGLGDKTIAALYQWAAQLDATPLRATQALGGRPDAALAAALERAPAPFSGRAERALAAFAELIGRLETASYERTIADLLAYVIQETNYAAFIRDGSEEGEERWQNVLELLGVARQYADLAPRAGLVALLENAALTTDADELDSTADRLTLLTLHAAKGLEFPVVLIVGFEEGICPHVRSFGDDERMAEERRLCYVGLTRAKERLYLVHAQQRSLYGGGMANAPSPYLADIPDDLLASPRRAAQRGGRRVIFADEDVEPHGRGPHVAPTWHTADDDQPAAAGGARRPGAARPLAGPPAPLEPRYAAGNRVVHQMFGEGIVVRSEMVRGDEQVTIQFRQVGVKTLLASMARLQRL
ncbi:MAG: ATP-binding domain-containing protein, partial [Chloroflexi bacterium]|nr:ATP-binding domain-containing protein [Chloroflexota bacterium]